MELRTALVLGSSLAFLSYGVHCLVSPSMRLEFARYRLAHLRVLTGLLEILAGVGLLAGLRWPLALKVSSGGLALLMGFALAARLRVRDALPLWIPAAALLALNAYLCLSSLGAFDGT